MFELNKITSRFTDYFNKESNSNISKLMKIFSDEMTALNNTTKRVGDWKDIDSAEGVVLDDTGTNINQPRGVATDEVYRILLKSKTARNLSDGSINTIIQVLATALSVPVTEIKIQEKWNDLLEPEPAAIKLIELPLQKINESGLDPVNFVRIVQKTVAAGVKTDIIELTGTFEFGTMAMIVDESKGFGNIEGSIGGYFGAALSPSSDQELPI